MDKKAVERRLQQIEKQVQGGRKSEGRPQVMLSDAEAYAIGAEILEDAERHPGKYSDDKLTGWRESQQTQERCLQLTDGIVDGDQTGQLAEQRRLEHERRFRDEVDAVRDVIRQVGLENFRPLGEAQHTWLAADYPGYAVLYARRNKQVTECDLQGEKRCQN